MSVLYHKKVRMLENMPTVAQAHFRTCEKPWKSKQKPALLRGLYVVAAADRIVRTRSPHVRLKLRCACFRQLSCPSPRVARLRGSPDGPPALCLPRLLLVELAETRESPRTNAPVGRLFICR